MENRIKQISFVLILALIVSMMPILPAIQNESEVYADESDYHAGDVAAFKKLCTDSGIELNASPAAWSNSNNNLSGWSNITEPLVRWGTISGSDEKRISGISLYNLAKNQRMSWDFSALTELYCGSNSLIAINVTGNQELVSLNCSINSLTTLDMTGNPKLTLLNCDSNSLTKIDISNNTVLETLNCSYNNISSLDLSKNLMLRSLSCYGRSDAVYAKLLKLNVSNNPALTILQCQNQELTSLDLTKSTQFTNLNCEFNNLKSLDLSKNPNLVSLNCFNNSLTELNLQNPTKLFTLACQNNNIKSLNLSNATSLSSLTCNNNSITALNLSRSKSLATLKCDDNPLSKLTLVNGGINAAGINGKASINNVDLSRGTATIESSPFPGFSMHKWTKNGVSLADKTSTIAVGDFTTSTYNIEAIFGGNLSKSKIVLGISKYSYSGSAKKPAVYLYIGNIKVNPKSYDVKYTSNTKVGKAKVTITGKNGSTGSASKTFTITPKKTSISKITGKKKSLTVKWKKVKGTTKYQIRYRIKGKKSWKTKTVSAKKNSYTIKKLKSKKTYQVQVRSYKTIKKVKYPSDWSKTKTKKTK